MKPVFRLCMVVFVALLVTVPMITTRAQGSVCLPGLQAADCALMTAANKGSITSSNMDYTLSLTVTGIEGLKSGSSALHDLSVTVSGNGPFSVEKGKLPAGAMSNDPRAWSTALSAITLGNTIKFSVANGPDKKAGDLEVRMIGGKIYFKSANADMYPANQKANVGKWLVATPDPQQFNEVPAASNAMLNDAQRQAMLQQLIAIPGFISAKRTDAGGEATFNIDISITALLKSPQFKPMLTALLAGLGERSGGSQMDENQVNAVIAFITPYFESLKISATDVVGTQDKLTHGLGFHVAFSLTPQQIQSLAALGGSRSAQNAPKLTKPLSLDLNFNVKLSNLNQPISVETPANAIPVKPSSAS